MKNISSLFYRNPDGSYQLPTFDIGRLLEFVKSNPNFGGLTGDKAYGLALAILTACFGIEWAQQHILSEPKDGFFGRPLGKNHGDPIVMHRVTSLAENVFNLLSARGIEAPLAQLAGGQIESAIAELEAGKLFRRCNLDFQYVIPSGVGGESFDFSLTTPSGLQVCLDTKCKLETTEFTSATILNSLDDARKRNLPKDKPCAVLLKIPQAWVGDQKIFSEMETVIWKFLRNNKKIVSVQVYASIVAVVGEVLNFQNYGWEYINSDNKFHPDLDWRVFGLNGGILPDASGWIRLTDIVQ